jgi:threonine dehydratase
VTVAPVEVSAESIRAAAAGLDGIAVRTPLARLPDIGGGIEAFVKCEQLQPIGAFKIRGAFTAVSRLQPAERARGIVTHSSGNHGQAVAFVARHFGIPAVIVMPADAPAVKQAGVRSHGAEISLVEERWQRQPRCDEIARERGLVVIPPYENPDVIAGQGTCGLEILEQCPDVRTILVPVGGGGLIAGIASAVRHFAPSVRVIGVEPEGAAKLARALEAGRPVKLDHTDSIADGLLPQAIGTLPFEIMRGVVHEAVQVGETEIADAVRYLYRTAGLTVEPSGAVTTAALRSGRLTLEGPVVAVASGGNVDPAVFERLTG